MPIYTINYTEVWNNDFHIEARSKEEAENIFIAAIDRDIIHPGDDCYFDSSDWTTEEALDAPDRYIDVSYRDFETPEPNVVDTLLNDPAFPRLGTLVLSLSVGRDYAKPLWQKIERNVAENIADGITEGHTAVVYNEDDMLRAVGKAMTKYLNIVQ